MIPGAGDELQGLKKVLSSSPILIAVNKADGGNIEAAKQAAADYRAALNILTPQSSTWIATGHYLFGCLPTMALTDCGPRFSHTRKKDDRLGRIGSAAPPPAGKMDVDDARGAADCTSA